MALFNLDADFDATLQRHIAREKIDLLVKGMKTASVSSVIAPLITVWLFYEFVAPALLWGPALFVYAQHIERFALFRRFAAARLCDDFEPQRWSRQLTWRLCLMGVTLALWTLSAVLTGNETVIFYAVTLASITVAGALTQFCIYPPALWAFVTPYLIGVALQLVWLRQPSTVVFAFYMVVLWLTLMLASKRFSAVLHSDIEQRYRNGVLLDELRLQKNRAEDASAAKTRFLAAASHDLRQPVHAVALLSAALFDNLSGRPDAASSTKLLTRLQSGVNQFSDVVDEILDVARFDANDEAVVLHSVPLLPLLARIDSTYREVAVGKGLSLIIRPPSDAHACVQADAALLWRVLSNLVSNAVRHTARGHVLVAVRRDGKYANSNSLRPSGWRMEVRDTGPGIAESQQALVFEEFYQLHNPQRDAKHGLGLGLAVAKRIAERMGLSISLRSKVGQGAVFAIAAPAAAVEPGVSFDATTPPDAAGVPQLQLAGLQALVVDDDASSSHALADLLRGWGLHVEVAGTAEQARTATLGLLAAGTPPQLLLTDHWLPGGENSQHVVQAVCGALAMPGAVNSHENGDKNSYQISCEDNYENTYESSCENSYENSSLQRRILLRQSTFSLKIAVLTGDISPATQHSITELGWHFAHKPVRPLALRMWLESVAPALHGAYCSLAPHLQEMPHVNSSTA